MDTNNVDTLYEFITSADPLNFILAYEMRNAFSKDEWFEVLNKICDNAKPTGKSAIGYIYDCTIYTYGLNRSCWKILRGVQNRRGYITFIEGSVTGNWLYYHLPSNGVHFPAYGMMPITELHRKTMQDCSIIKHRGKNQLKKVFEQLRKVKEAWESSLKTT